MELGCPVLFLFASLLLCFLATGLVDLFLVSPSVAGDDKTADHTKHEEVSCDAA